MKLKRVHKMIVGVWGLTVALLIATISYMIAVPNTIPDYILLGIEVFVLIPLCVDLPLKIKGLTPEELETFEKRSK